MKVKKYELRDAALTVRLAMREAGEELNKRELREQLALLQYDTDALAALLSRPLRTTVDDGEIARARHTLKRARAMLTGFEGPMSAPGPTEALLERTVLAEQRAAHAENKLRELREFLQRQIDERREIGRNPVAPVGMKVTAAAERKEYEKLLNMC